jgi:hypothetical protein
MPQVSYNLLIISRFLWQFVSYFWCQK